MLQRFILQPFFDRQFLLNSLKQSLWVRARPRSFKLLDSFHQTEIFLICFLNLNLKLFKSVLLIFWNTLPDFNILAWDIWGILKTRLARRVGPFLLTAKCWKFINGNISHWKHVLWKIVLSLIQILIFIVIFIQRADLFFQRNIFSFQLANAHFQLIVRRQRAHLWGTGNYVRCGPAIIFSAINRL